MLIAFTMTQSVSYFCNLASRIFALPQVFHPPFEVIAITMLQVAPWRRPIFSAMASRNFARLGIYQQFPTTPPHALVTPSCSRGFVKFWKMNEMKAVVNAYLSRPETNGNPSNAGQPWLSRLIIAITFRSKNVANVEIVPIQDNQAETANCSEAVLSEEQEELVSLAEKGYNIFYTGSAGSGKSTVMRAIRNRLLGTGKMAVVLAPTGKVAIANDGITLWSFVDWTPNTRKRGLSELTDYENNIRLFERLQRVDTVIIDEISMVENLDFELLNEVMKAAHSSPLPFGGVQIIVTGDFFQLPPVKPFRCCNQCGSEFKYNERERTYQCPKKTCDAPSYHEIDKWAFRSKVWEECNFHYVYLHAIYRQKDPKFIKILQKCRLGFPLTDAEIDLLAKPDAVMDDGAMKIFPTREEVRRLNELESKKLKTRARRYTCEDVFIWNKRGHPHLKSKGNTDASGCLVALEHHRFDAELELKEGMQVVLQTNLDLARGLCNGTQGKIVRFDPFEDDPPRFSIYSEQLPVCWPKGDVNKEKIGEFMKKCTEAEGWPVVEFANGMSRRIYPICQALVIGDKRPFSLLGRIQVPLAPAWALTVHKSQGMTLDRVDVKVGRMFEVGQLYVALSRARTLEGLRVVGDLDALRRCRRNLDVMRWMEEKFGRDITKVE